MKKLISLVLMVCSLTFLMAEEKKLFDSSISADLDGFDYVKNFEIVSDSGHFSKKDLIILEPNENGLRFAAVNPPMYQSCNYKILVSYPSYFNDSIEGAGMIYNAGSIKSIKIVCATNRPYDEIFLMYSTSPYGKIEYVKFPQNFDSVKSFEENTFIFENPLYEADIKKRDIINRPVVGSDADGIYLRGFKIQTNAATGYNEYSPYSILYLKEVSLIYDKAFDDDKIELSKQIQEEFKLLGSKENAKKKAKEKIEQRERVRTGMELLMAKEGNEQKQEDVK